MANPNGAAIRAARERSGLKPKSFLVKLQQAGCDISYTHLMNIEKGHNTAAIEVLYAIANALKLHIGQVVASDDEQVPA